MYQTKKVTVIYVVILAICLGSIFALPQSQKDVFGQVPTPQDVEESAAKQDMEKDDSAEQNNEQESTAMMEIMSVPPVDLSSTVKIRKAPEIDGVHFITTVFGKSGPFTAEQVKISNLLNRFFKFIFAMVGIYLVLVLAVRGVQLIYAGLQGKVTGIPILKEKIVSIFVSLVILLLSYLILSTVNPALVDLKVDIPDTKAGVSFTGLMGKMSSKNFSSKEEAINAGKVCPNGANLNTIVKPAPYIGTGPDLSDGLFSFTCK